MKGRTLSAEHKRKMQEGRRRARAQRPQRLVVVEARMDVLGAELRQLPLHERKARAAVRKELRELGAERLILRYGEAVAS